MPNEKIPSRATNTALLLSSLLSMSGLTLDDIIEATVENETQDEQDAALVEKFIQRRGEAR